MESSSDETVEQNMQKGPDQQKESQEEQEDEEEDDEEEDDESDEEDVLSGNCLEIPSLTFLWVAKHAEILYKSLCMAVAAMHDS